MGCAADIAVVGADFFDDREGADFSILNGGKVGLCQHAAEGLARSITPANGDGLNALKGVDLVDQLLAGLGGELLQRFERIPTRNIKALFLRGAVSGFAFRGSGFSCL